MPNTLHQLRNEAPVAYFSMEIALEANIPTYSGGLGVLAGDMVRSAADLGIPFVAISQVSRNGYFRQVLSSEGMQREEPATWEPAGRLAPLEPAVEVLIEGRRVNVRGWLYEHASPHGSSVPVVLLDTRSDDNDPRDRTITDELYGGDARHRLAQEIVLGVGGARSIAALGIAPRKFHMNEGHAALVALELLTTLGDRPDEEALAEVRRRCVFTTHTPVASGHDRFPYDLVADVMRDDARLHRIKAVAGHDELNMTALAMNTSGYVNGVAKRHQEVSSRLFPGHRIFAITNGVHSYTWTAPPFRKLYDEFLPGWAAEPALLARVDVIPERRIWDAHQETKRDLLALVQERTGITLNDSVLTIGFARRATAYKRPELLFSDLERLRAIATRFPLQLVYAGKAHPHDTLGKDLIAHVHGFARQLGASIPCVYLSDYDMGIAAKVVAGVDVWLNTPAPPLEASGTSGMKAAHNGVLNFSVLDGWWVEGHHEGVTGWSIGPPPGAGVSDTERRALELRDLYGKLEYAILPKYYGRPTEWTRMMAESIDDLASYFNAHRMLRRYVTDAYFRID